MIANLVIWYTVVLYSVHCTLFGSVDGDRKAGSLRYPYRMFYYWKRELSNI